MRWSGAADPDSLPSTWDYTDPTNDAGQIPLSDSPGAVIDALELGDSLIIYKQRATYQMSYIGGNDIFGFQKIFPTTGMLAARCGCAIDNYHFVVTTDDVIVHDRTFNSIGNRWCQP